MSKLMKLINGEIEEIKSELGVSLKIHNKKENNIITFDLDSCDGNFTNIFDVDVSNENEAIINILNQLENLEKNKVKTVVKNFRNSFLE